MHQKSESPFSRPSFVSVDLEEKKMLQDVLMYTLHTKTVTGFLYYISGIKTIVTKTGFLYVCLLACLLTCILAYLLTCLFPYLLSYLLTYLPYCLVTCLLVYLHANLLIF